MSRSARIFRRALKAIPGGVNSPVRAWKAVSGKPLIIARGRGSSIIDVDGRSYIDFVGSWGPLILGHAHPEIVRIIRARAASGFTFGAPTLAEVELAERVSQIVPSIQSFRVVSSGTEAAMTAIRLARAYTGRRKVIKFDGCYHGHADGLLAKAGSGVATFALPESPGIPAELVRQTLIANYNDLISVQSIFEAHKSEIAAIIVEAICGNMGVIPPQPGFLRGLSDMARRNGALLIFDEVITGFRVALGGAQEIFRVNPDLTCLGKILGGGLPLAGFGGRRKIMNLLAPAGPVYQAGTLSGNPIAVNAGLATLKLLSRPGVYRALEQKGRRLELGFREVLARHGITAALNRVGSMLTVFFGVGDVRDAASARLCDRRKFSRFFHAMLDRGIYLPPSPFEAMFISLAHSNADLDTAIHAFNDWARKEGKT
jgi:glutamate-1-semialdehyde 2,1-aminomutase